jgi:hypothetical protein
MLNDWAEIYGDPAATAVSRFLAALEISGWGELLLLL